MAIQTVKTGAAVNDGTGDDARTAFTKINQNFTDGTHAASRLVGTEAGNVMEVGAFGWGRKNTDGLVVKSKAFLDNMDNWRSGLDCYNDPSLPGQYGAVIRLGFGTEEANRWLHDLFFTTGGELYLRHSTNSATFGDAVAFLSPRNTQVDTTNGYIKKASPIVKLFTDKIELNDEAELQPITFEKLGVGDYLVKGSTGFAQEGWYIETPKDANGNVLVAVVYKQLANNDISVKTYAKMFDPDTGDIVANTAKPRDIPATRWIDLRLQALPQDGTQPYSKDETVATNAK